MQFDVFGIDDVDAAPNVAAELEAAGFDGVWAIEAAHDPFLQLLRMSEATSRITLGTNVAVAFARNPLVVATLGHDMQRYSHGRFVLGLGTQVKAHIERRFSMPWSKPTERLREFVHALRAIWDAWATGEPLAFDGEFYTHTLMTPFFSPAPHEYGPPPVYLAGFGPRMTEVAGEVADGFFFHPMATPRYLREVTLPALARHGRDVTVAGPAFVAVGRNERELAFAVDGVRRQLAFYASTPAYRAVLDLHGWGDLQPELHALVRAGRWDDLPAAIDDEVVAAFAEVGDVATVAAAVRTRFEGLAERVAFYLPYEADPALLPALLDAAR